MSELKRYDLQASWCGGSQVELDIEESEYGDWIKASDFDELSTRADGWISVDERLPDYEKRVLLYWKESEHIEDGAFYDGDNGPYHALFDGEMLNHEPSHWMPMPQTPEPK